MKIVMGSDHAGYELKEALKTHYQNLKMADLGTYDAESVDYPDMAQKMAHAVLSKMADLGILICGTGIGISIAANRFKGIRAALIYSQDAARLAKEHNNANVLVFGGRTMAVDDVIKYIDTFMQSTYQGGRHQRRLDKLDNME